MKNLTFVLLILMVSCAGQPNKKEIYQKVGKLPVLQEKFWSFVKSKKLANKVLRRTPPELIEYLNLMNKADGFSEKPKVAVPDDQWIKDIKKAINRFQKTKCDSLFSASEIGDFYMWKKKGKKLTSLNYDYQNRSRRQDFSNQYVENGSIYIFKPQILKKFNNRLAGKIEISLMEFWKSFEIDSYEDIDLCETLMKHYILGLN